MLRFFRTIRQSLLAQGQITRYLVYALGEILLVVIGILIALQINDWSAHRKLQRTNLMLMEKLVEDLNLNKERLHFLDTGYHVMGVPSGLTPMLANTDTALRFLNEPLSNKQVEWLVHNDFYYSNLYNLSNSVYQEMLNTGRFYTLGTPELIARLQRYYRLVDREEYYAIVAHTETEEAWAACKYGFNDLKIDYKKIGKEALVYHPWIIDKRSQSYLDLKAAMYCSHNNNARNLSHLHKMLAHTDTLITLLESELNKRP